MEQYNRQNQSRGLKRQDGQVLIEFFLTFLLCIGFCMAVIRVAYVFSFTNYIQYAVYMASRAYYSGGASPDAQSLAAENVLKKTVKLNSASQDRAKDLAEGFGGSGNIKGAVIGPHPAGFRADDLDLSSLQGVRYTFKSRIFPPLDTQVTLRSESYLGREVSNAECESQMKTGSTFWVIDNGC